MFNSFFGGDPFFSGGGGWGAPSGHAPSPFAPPSPFFGAYGGFPHMEDMVAHGGGWSGSSSSSSSSTITIVNGVKTTRTTRTQRLPDGRVVSETTESTERVGGGDLGGRVGGPQGMRQSRLPFGRGM